jgi:hypothetical protein
MPRVYLKSGNPKYIFYKERLGCADEDMIYVRDYEKTFEIPKANIAYIEE